MKDPNHEKGIMYLILFSSFIPFGIGAYIQRDHQLIAYLLFALGGALMIASLIYGIKNVRCPHCGSLLDLRLWPLRTCPYCKKRVDRFL